MLSFLEALKRILVGRPEATGRRRPRPLRLRAAIPAQSTSALSSLAYFPDEILLTLAVAGVAGIQLGPWVGLAVAAVLLLLVACYRISVRAYPDGRGDYQITRQNLGPVPGVVVGSALLLDLALTVAVSMSAAAHYVVAAWPDLDGKEGLIAAAGVVIVGVLALRGMGRSPLARALPTVVFVCSLALIVVVGLLLAATGRLGEAPSAELTLVPLDDAGVTGLFGLALVLRAFSTGSAALTGVETPISGVNELGRPRAVNAGRVLVSLGVAATVLTLGVMWLARATGIHVVEDPTTQLTFRGEPVQDYVQAPVLSQLTQAVLGTGWPVVVFGAVTVLVLLAAGLSGFSSFPRLAFHLATDGYLPRQLRTRGDRMGYSNGILVLAASALVLVLATGAHLSVLVQLYVVGVFVSFTLSQAGMTRHWTLRLRALPRGSRKSALHRRRLLSVVGASLSLLVLAVVLITKFTHGAWLAVLAIVVLTVGMTRIHAHYVSVDAELAVPEAPKAGSLETALPSRVHAVVLVSTVRKPVLRALSYARATRPQHLEAVLVDNDPEKSAKVVAAWTALQLPTPLTVLASPYRDMLPPLLNHIRRLRAKGPRDLVVVYLPEYVVGHWWETLVHNQVGLRLRSRLRREPGVVLATVPWQLTAGSAEPVRQQGTHQDMQNDVGE
ncbi:MAG: APC family permease [Galactobacter sp.]